MPIFKGKLQATATQMAAWRRPQSKVRVCVVGLGLMGWVEAVEAWGAEVESVVVQIPDDFKDIMQKLSITLITTPEDALCLSPLGPWDGCMLANIATPQDSCLVWSLFKRWHPAIAILLTHLSVSRVDTIAMLPSGLPQFYHKNMFTVCHVSIGGVTSASWRFTHYT